MAGDNSMSERILTTLETIFNNDLELKDFSIVFTEDNTKNKSPVLYHEYHHSLGLESWCIKYIYRHAYADLIEIRKALQHKKLALHKMKSINHLLIGALLINPNVTTFWNMKRELVENDILSIEKELIFTKVVLTYKSKSNETFAYRKWLLRKVLDKIDNNDFGLRTNLLENELSVSEMAVNKAQNNYHGWTHRLWCMQNIAVNIPNISQIVLSELEFSCNWINSHVSEHIGYRYRQYLFELVKGMKNNTTIYERYYKYLVKHLQLVNDNEPRNILLFLLGKRKCYADESNDFVNYFCLLLFDLFHTVENLNSVFPNHESVWYHRRYLFYHLIKCSYEYHNIFLNMSMKLDEVKGENMCNNLSTVDFKFNNENGEKQPKLFKSQPDAVKLSFLYQVLIKNEMKLISNSNFFNCEFSRKYVKWLKLIINFDEV